MKTMTVKKILLVLDASPAGDAAKAYAFQLAKVHGAFLSGVSILDTPWIMAAQPEPLGGSIFKLQRDEKILEHSREHITEMVTSFKKEANDQGLNVLALEGEGFPSNVIERVSYANDLIVIGKTTDIHFELEEDSDVIVAHVARDNPRPVIIVPPAYQESKGTVIALDGSLASQRALHMFVLLGLSRQEPVDIICIDKNDTYAHGLLDDAVTLCKAHGIEATPHAMVESKAPSQHILDHVNKKNPGLLVMGGFGHSALRDTLLGSTTKKVLKELAIPLMIHH